MTGTLDIRPSPIAGQWYPGDADDLATAVDTCLAGAGAPIVDGGIVALVAPHAGYQYSGKVAGHAFRVAQGLAPDLVVVVGPLHYPWPGRVLTSGHEAYVTPLGPVPIDQDAVRELDASLHAELGHGLAPLRHDAEHSLEIELPFLQRALGAEFRLLPVMVRAQTPDVARGLGRALARTIERSRALVIASTDLSHYYPQRRAQDLDAELLRRLATFDPDAVLRAEEEGKGFACGVGALAAVLWAARDLGADTARVLHHATSGDVTGDYERVVGYAAAVVTRQKSSGGQTR